jgi:hypothetical protein
MKNECQKSIYDVDDKWKRLECTTKFMFGIWKF